VTFGFQPSCMAASVFSFSMAAWSWEYHSQISPHLTSNAYGATVDGIHHSRITSIQYQTGSQILPVEVCKLAASFSWLFKSGSYIPLYEEKLFCC